MALGTESPPIDEGLYTSNMEVPDNIPSDSTVGRSMPPTSTYFSPNPTAWPWLHEDIFLQGDFNLDWFELQANPASTLEDGQPLGVSDQLLTGSTTDSAVTKQEQVIDDLVFVASDIMGRYGDGRGPPRERTEAHARLESASSDALEAFEMHHHGLEMGTDADSRNLGSRNLGFLVNLYLSHFWPLWPTCSKYQFEKLDIEPLLYLVMASIGAMYGGKQASTFGTMLHERLRDELINPLLDIDLPRECMLPLGQARSLTQAAALYFGQKRAFSYAHHLGGALIAQARRMGLFSRPRMKVVQHVYEHEDPSSYIKTWVAQESRKRLAFAILRLEMYTSVLHSTRPLVSPEELDIELPCSHSLWSSSSLSDEAFAAAVRQELATRSLDLPYSDLFRIVSDPEEELPHLVMLHQELVMNGMQERVWMACMAKASFERLVPERQTASGFWLDTGLEEQEHVTEPTALGNLPSRPRALMMPASIDAHLAETRTMTQLRNSIHQTTSCLKKLRAHALSAKRRQTYGQSISQMDRSSLLSCLLVYHLAFMQIHAPIASINKLCHTLPLNGTKRDDVDTGRLVAWAQSPDAVVAAKHAGTIYHLLNSEAQKPIEERASVNFLTVMGLYHSGVLTWTISAILKTNSNNEISETGFSMETQTIHHTMPSIGDFVSAFHSISPAWAARSSFSAAMQKLSKTPSPF